MLWVLTKPFAVTDTVSYWDRNYNEIFEKSCLMGQLFKLP